MKYTPRQAKTNVNVTPTSPAKEFFVLTGGLVVIVVGIYFLLGLAVNLLVPHLSVDFEIKLANTLMPKFEEPVEFEEHEAYLQSLADNIQNSCARLPYNFKIHFNSTDQFNAVALPGGHIIVFKDLFDAAEAENELAFVLAHEMGHYANRDHLKAMGRGLVFMAVSTALFGADSGVSDLIGSGLGLTELSFSRGRRRAPMNSPLARLTALTAISAEQSNLCRSSPKRQTRGKWGTTSLPIPKFSVE